MNDEQGDLRDRVTQLEAEVADLRRSVESLQETLDRRREAPKSPPTPAEPRPRREAAAPPETTPGDVSGFELPQELFTAEYWLNKIGIGLLLFGLAFLFKYAIDQGWLTPAVRVGIGLTIGASLLVVGLRVRRERPAFSQVMFGGSVAAFYITGFAAFQLYDLVPHAVAFVFMVGVTVLAFALAVWQQHAVLSLIGALGGLGTPFLLYTDGGSTAGLVAYTCLVLAGTSAIYFYHEWRSLLWVSTVGGWVVLAIAMDSLPAETSEAFVDRVAMQAGIVFAWLAFWALPLVRHLLTEWQPARWAQVQPEPGSIQAQFRSLTDKHVHVLSVATPLLALAFTAGTWDLSEYSAGGLALGGSLLYALVAYVLVERANQRGLAFAQAVAATALLTVGFVLLLDGDMLFIVLAVEATALHVIAARLDDAGTAILGHILSVAVGFWLGIRLVTGEADGRLLLNAPALTNLATIALLALSSTTMRWRPLQWAYGLVAHAALLAWFARELAPLPNGGGYTTLAWGLYGTVLLVIGLMRDRLTLRQLGLGTMLLMVAKLFLVDLSELDALWRILLFLGFGALFLVISYYFQSLWRPAPSAQHSE